jgi:uracil-DNA glycosylase family 4
MEKNEKDKKLNDLKDQMSKDNNLPLIDANLVFGEGNPDTNIVFIGEAPGFNEDLERRPFVGQAGKLLNKLIEGIGWKRSDIYITNIVKRRPPENRDPSIEEIAAYTPYLEKQLEIIDPKIIVPLGRFAMNHFLPEAKISRDQGKLFWQDNRLIIPLYHPAAALRSGGVLEDLQKSFAKLPIALKKFDIFLKERLGTAQKIEKPKQNTLF